MTEIRPIRPEEGDDFLRLLCDCFALDFDRAIDVFYVEPFFDLTRKWALFEGREMVSVLTTTPLIFGWGRAAGIAGVATRRDRRNEGHAGRLLERVFRESQRRGEDGLLLFAQDARVYERNGFEPFDRVVRAPIAVDVQAPVPEVMAMDDTVARYDEWAFAHPDRLRRDSLRWSYWRWQMRLACPVADGYFVDEAGLVRETVFTPGVRSLPATLGSEWLGTTLMADQLELPLGTPTVELYLMGRGVPGVPQLFMTDQF